MRMGMLAPGAQLAVDLGYLLNPATAVAVLEGEDALHWPVEVVRDVGYLLVEPVQGVAYDSPRPSTVSTSKLWPHSGQVVATLVLPFSLIRRYRFCK
jgi:hypothetical protein